MIKEPAASAFEAGYFEAYSGKGNYKPSKIKQMFRTRLVRRYVPAGGSLLELGCAYGYLLAALQDRYDCHGIDISEHAISAARSTTSAHLACGDVLELLPGFAAGSFDGVLAFDVLEHIPEGRIPAVVYEVARILKPGGTLILTVPNTAGWSASARGDDWHGRRDPTHCSLLSPESWLRLLEPHMRILRAGGDGLWDAPYVPLVPRFVQKAALAPTSLLATATAAAYPRFLSENLVLVGRTG